MVTMVTMVVMEAIPAMEDIDHMVAMVTVPRGHNTEEKVANLSGRQRSVGTVVLSCDSHMI